MPQKYFNKQALTLVFCFFINGIASANEIGGGAIYLGLNWSSTTVEVSGTTRANEPVDINGIGQQAITAQIGGDYMFTPGNDGVVIVGLSYDPSGYTIADGTITSEGGALTTLNAEIDSVLSVYVAPGLKVNPSTVLYAKLAYQQGDATVVVSGINTSDVNESRTFSGLGYGFGIRTMMKDGLFAAAEVLRTNYDDEGFESLNYGNGSTTGSLIIGLQF